MVLIVPGLLAFVFGWFAFRSRVTGVYLSIITQAMTYALLLAFFRNDMGFGGNNGLTDFKDILGFNVQAERNARGAVCALGHLPCARPDYQRPASPGRNSARCWSAVRDAESRTRFLGYRVENVKLFAFTSRP
jgi:urea transport system permease protein